VQIVSSNESDAKELARQAAVLYVSIGNAIDPTEAKEVLQGKQGSIALVIRYGSSLVTAYRKLNVVTVL
jgi:hypothetical protein